MKKAKILLSFTKLSDARLDVKANVVLTAMTGNEHFPKPEPSLEALGIAIQNFSAATVAAQSRHRLSVAAKKEKRGALLQVMTDLAHYINYNFGGDRVACVSTGYDVSAEFNSPQLLGEPLNFAVQPGKTSGEAWVSMDSVENAVAYLYFYSLAPVVNDAWRHVRGEGCSLLITGLEPGKAYSFRIGALGSSGQMVYTDIITRVV